MLHLKVAKTSVILKKTERKNTSKIKNYYIENKVNIFIHVLYICICVHALYSIFVNYDHTKNASSSEKYLG